MKPSFLNSYLRGIGSTLDLAPNTDLDEEYHRLLGESVRVVFASTSLVRAHAETAELRRAYCTYDSPNHLAKQLITQGSVVLFNDKDPLSCDWKNVGTDLLVASQKATKKATKPRKEQTDCWGS